MGTASGAGGLPVLIADKRSGIPLEREVRGERVFIPPTPDGARHIASDLLGAADVVEAPVGAQATLPTDIKVIPRTPPPPGAFLCRLVAPFLVFDGGCIRRRGSASFIAGKGGLTCAERCGVWGTGKLLLCCYQWGLPERRATAYLRD